MVSHIKRSRTAVYQNPCDNFLYGVKVAACRPRRPWRDVAEMGKSRGGMPVKAAGSMADVGPAEGERASRQGKAVPGAAWASPAASRAAALRRGRPRRQVRAPG